MLNCVRHLMCQEMTTSLCLRLILSRREVDVLTMREGMRIKFANRVGRRWIGVHANATQILAKSGSERAL